MRRSVLTLALVALGVVVVPPDAHAKRAGGGVMADFNGDGYADLAIGVPQEAVGTVQYAGAVNVLYGSASGLSATSVPDQLWTQNTAFVEETAEEFDSYAWALAVGDFNGDGRSDLAVGVTEESVGSAPEASGAVHVLYGSASGLSATAIPDQLWSQDTASVEGSAQAWDRFGWSLAAGDFNGDGRTDLAVGVSHDQVGTAVEGGAVNVLYGSVSGLSATAIPDQLWSQDTAEVNGVTESYDRFGDALSAGDYNGDGRSDLAVGVQYESLGQVDEGGVNVLYGSAAGLSATTVPDQFWSQNSANVEGGTEDQDRFGYAVASGDFNRDGRADLAIGVPFEDVTAGSAGVDAGGVNVLYGSAAGLSATTVPDQFWSQDTSDVEGDIGDDDWFGTAVCSGDFNGDGRADLTVGVTQEDVSGFDDAGGANVLYGSTSGLSATAVKDQFWSQDTMEVKDSAAEVELMGTACAAGDFNDDGRSDLAVGVRFEDVGSAFAAGGVNVLHGSASGLSAISPEDQFWTQASPNVEGTAETVDQFGQSLASGSG
jgi:FG-GAP repeat protein